MNFKEKCQALFSEPAGSPEFTKEVNQGCLKQGTRFTTQCVINESSLTQKEMARVGAYIMQLIDKAGQTIPDNLYKPLNEAWKSKYIERIKAVGRLIREWSQISEYQRSRGIPPDRWVYLDLSKES
jgi:hypothetical protein